MSEEKPPEDITPEDKALEVSATEISAPEVGLPEVRTPEVRTPPVITPEVRTSVVGAGPDKMTLNIVRIVFALVIVALGAGAMIQLAKMAQKPEKIEQKELVVRAVGIRVHAEDVRTALTGTASVRSRRYVRLSAEVTGRIVEMHPQIKPGELVSEGELLYAIDSRNYQLRCDDAAAEIERLNAEQERLNLQEQNFQRQLAIARSSLALAQSDFERIKKLSQSGGVETRARLETSELALNREKTQVTTLENSLDILPVQRQQTEMLQRKAQVRKEEAEINLERTRILAPFSGRVIERSGELGQVISPGQPLITLADDSTLELPVPLNSIDAARFLDVTPGENAAAWFDKFPDREVTVRWVEAPDEYVWQGKLVRVEKYNPASRMLTVVVEVRDDEDAVLSPNGRGFPLIEGMFCKVEIPGRMAKSVFRVPSGAISKEGADDVVLLGNGGRLETRRVTVLKLEPGTALVAEGLNDGDLVLTSRPAKVIDGIRVEVMIDGVLAPETVIPDKEETEKSETGESETGKSETSKDEAEK